MKKKIFMAISVLMLLIAIGFVIYALGHPDGSFPWSNTITYAIYSIYIVSMVGFFIASRRTSK